MRFGLFLLIQASAVSASEWVLAEKKPHPGEARGAEFTDEGPLVWGRDLPVRGSFQAGGCAGDVNGDGRGDLVLQESGELLWLEAPSWKRHRIDGDAEFADCSWTTISGKRGVLLIHRQIQLRFYWQSAGKWEYRDLYSIYTPSAQGGLLRGDVDGDGREDVFAGNYWLHAPAEGDRGWRLFAINTWWDQARSAMLRLALTGDGKLVAAQREASPAKAAVFTRPSDPKQFWTGEPLEASPPLRFVQGLAADAGSVFAAENAGADSRVVEFRAGRASLVGSTHGLFALRAAGGELSGAGPDATYRWRRVTTGSGRANTTKRVRDSKASRP